MKNWIMISHGSVDNPRQVRVAATVLGTWAYHRSRYDGYTITHVPSGQCLNYMCPDLALKDAQRLARRLQVEFSKRHWRSKDVSEVPHDDRWALQSVVAEELAR